MRVCIALIAVSSAFGQVAFEPGFQYHHGSVAVPNAYEDEPRAAVFSPAKALDYLEKGAVVWTRQRVCVSCHTSGTYMLVRSQLAGRFGPPNEEVRAKFLAEVGKREKESDEWFRRGTNAEQVIYVAAGLAEYDARVSGRLAPETDRALRLMFRAQLESGSWSSESCWPPLESSAFHAATIAARAAAVAPGWRDRAREDPALSAAFERLLAYLRSSPPQHDYDRVSLLWTASVLPKLLDGARRKAIVARIRSLQNPDGGWSLRSFAAPEAWGDGSRAGRLRAEPDFAQPPSDGHMTGLCLVALHGAGVSAKDAHVRRGLAWLKANQRESGRWWTRSLNTDQWNFITYSGSAYPLLALDRFAALETLSAKGAKR